MILILTLDHRLVIADKLRRLQDISSPPAWKRQTAPQSAHKGGSCNKEVDGLPYPPYSSDLGPSDFHFLAHWNMHSEDAVLRSKTCWITACVKISDASAKSFRRPAYSVSPKGRKSVFIMKETFWENNLNFVEDIPMIYANFIIIIVIVSEEKIGCLTFVSVLLLK